MAGLNQVGQAVPLRWFGTAATMVAVTLLVAMLAGWPPYRLVDSDRAFIKVSLRHTGALIGECRTLTADELQRLPPNMRAPQECPRDRSPLVLQMDVDGRRLIDATLPAQGLHSDGRAAFYRRLPIPAGTRWVDIRMKDDIRQSQFRYQASHRVELEPGRALIIDFDDRTDSFVFL